MGVGIFSLFKVFLWEAESHSQPSFTCSNSKIETLEQGVKHVQS